MPDSSGKNTFDVRAFLSSLSDEPLADGQPVVFVRSQQEQRAFVGRALDALQLVPDVAENRVPLFSSATQAITSVGDEARDNGYIALADALTELMWSLLRIHADRAEYEGEWGQVFEGHPVNAQGVGEKVDDARRKWEPKHSSDALRNIHHGVFHANRLLLEIYLTGRVRGRVKPGR